MQKLVAERDHRCSALRAVAVPLGSGLPDRLDDEALRRAVSRRVGAPLTPHAPASSPTGLRSRIRGRACYADSPAEAPGPPCGRRLG